MKRRKARTAKEITMVAATSGLLEVGFDVGSLVAAVSCGSAEWMPRLLSVRRMLSAVWSVSSC